MSDKKQLRETTGQQNYPGSECSGICRTASGIPCTAGESFQNNSSCLVWTGVPFTPDTESVISMLLVDPAQEGDLYLPFYHIIRLESPEQSFAPEF